jgi:hypothetical protein
MNLNMYLNKDNITNIEEYNQQKIEMFLFV